MKNGGMKIAQGLILILITIGGIGTTILVAAPPSDNQSGTTSYPERGELVVRGEVVMIEGEVQMVEDPASNKREEYLVMDQLYVAKDIGDEAIQFHVNEKTRVDDNVMVGDVVEVLASGNGNALSIKKTK